MRKRIIVRLSTLLLFATVLMAACSGERKNAKYYLSAAEEALQQRNYALAKLKIDSIKILFPKAYPEINAGFKLMQLVRREENLRNIAYCDSMLTIDYAILQEKLTRFKYVRDKQYQEFGYYIPSAYPDERTLQVRTLRSGVSEKGLLYIESVLPGGNIKHNKARVSTKDGSFAETLSVTSEGLNYRFSTINNTYEIVRYTGNDENGIANFIYTFQNQPLTVTLTGTGSVSFPLSKIAVESICQSIELAATRQRIEELKFEKERSEALLRYLDKEANR